MNALRTRGFRRNLIVGLSVGLVLNPTMGAFHSASAQSAVMRGKFEVSPTGAATYQLPITAPPGTAGMVPSLSLAYSSQVSNGVLGIGWTLDGLPTMGRCQQTLAQDGVQGSVGFDANDRFCLDGDRLVAVSGAYGADGTEYRTEVESYSKIISHGTTGTGPTWFEVRTKNGLIMQFGNTTDSRVIAPGKTSARVWSVNKVADTKGNYLTVGYNLDSPNGIAYPARIDYTANDAAGLTAYNSVQFFYATRPDVAVAFHAGSQVRTVSRLTNIKTYSGPNIVADYRLTYEQSGAVPVSRLKEVKLCAADDSCLPPTTFTTSGAAEGTFSPGAVAVPNGWTFGSPTAWTTISGDFNGDGKSDYAMLQNSTLRVFVSNGDATFQASTYAIPNEWDFGTTPNARWMLIGGDFNGDGKSDFAMLNGSTVYVFFGNIAADGTGGFIPAVYAIPYGLNFGDPPASSWTLVQGDFNGDGKSDFGLLNGGVLYTFSGNFSGSGSGNFFLGQYAIPNGWNFGSPPSSSWMIIPGDYDGDGRTDFALLNGSYLFVFFGATSGGLQTFYPAVFAIPNGWYFGNPAAALWTLVTGDFNGDGKSDFALINGSTLCVFFSSGDGAFLTSGSTLPNGWSFGTPNDWGLFTGDLNNDGRTDFALIQGSTIRSLLSNGDGTFAPASYAIPFGWGFGSPASWSLTMIAGDFKGDGKGGIVLLNNNVQFSFFADGPAYHLLTSITDGAGVNTAIAYQPLTNGSIYTRGTTATYPIVDIQGAIYAVTQVNITDGVGGTSGKSYAYAGAKVDRSGRGFLGFRETRTVDLQTTITRTRLYRQDYPFIFLVEGEFSTFWSQILNTVTNTYSSTALGRTRYQVFLNQSVTGGIDLDNSPLPVITTSYQYDIYGNATQISVSTADGTNKTTINTYTNDATNWLLGRLTSSIVTSSLP